MNLTDFGIEEVKVNVIPKSNFKPTDHSQKPLVKQPPKYSIEYCEGRILDEGYLWDLRCWRKNHDLEEVKAFVAAVATHNEDWKNCGHVIFCMRMLMEDYDYPQDKIVDLIMRNNQLQFVDQLGSGYVCETCHTSKVNNMCRNCENCGGW